MLFICPRCLLHVLVCLDVDLMKMNDGDHSTGPNQSHTSYAWHGRPTHSPQFPSRRELHHPLNTSEGQNKRPHSFRSIGPSPSTIKVTMPRGCPAPISLALGHSLTLPSESPLHARYLPHVLAVCTGAPWHQEMPMSVYLLHVQETSLVHPTRVCISQSMAKRSR